MQLIDQLRLQAHRLRKLVQVLRLVAVVEVDAHDGHGIDLLLQSGWHLARKALHINRRARRLMQATSGR